MKILMVNKFLYPRGGAETYVFKLGEQLRLRGHQVQYFGMQDSRNTVGNALGLATRPLDFHAKGAARLLYPFYVLYSREAKRKIQAVAEAFQPDIVHLNNINYQLTPSVIDGVRAMGIPVVQTVHDSQMVCPSHTLLDIKNRVPCQRCVQGSKWHCAARRCIHGSLAKSILGSMEGVLYQRLGSYGQVARFLCPSRFLQSILEQDRRFVGRTQVLPNFIERPRLPAGAKKRDYVLYFGRLSVEKGVEELLAACRLCPEIPVVIAGSGPLEPLMSGAPGNVRYVGFQTGEALHRLIAEARFSVYPSIWYENCPLSVLESQALGTPVLATPLGGAPELILPGRSGLLLESLHPEGLAAQMRALYQSPEELAAMWAYCREQEIGLSPAQYCEKLLAIYRQTMAAQSCGA